MLEKNKWNYNEFHELITEAQEHVLMAWVEANDIDPNTLEYTDDWMLGFQVYGKKKNDKSGESWGIDFIRRKDGERS